MVQTLTSGTRYNPPVSLQLSLVSQEKSGIAFEIADCSMIKALIVSMDARAQKVALKRATHMKHFCRHDLLVCKAMHAHTSLPSPNPQHRGHLMKFRSMTDHAEMQVNYKNVMKEYNLGPNGGILTSLNLFATRFDQVRERKIAMPPCSNHAENSVVLVDMLECCADSVQLVASSFLCSLSYCAEH